MHLGHGWWPHHVVFFLGVSVCFHACKSTIRWLMVDVQKSWRVINVILMVGHMSSHGSRFGWTSDELQLENSRDSCLEQQGVGVWDEGNDSCSKNCDPPDIQLEGGVLGSGEHLLVPMASWWCFRSTTLALAHLPRCDTTSPGAWADSGAPWVAKVDLDGGFQGYSKPLLGYKGGEKLPSYNYWDYDQPWLGGGF